MIVFTCFCNLVFIDKTINGKRYQHVLALCATVHAGNIEETIFGTVFHDCYWCVCSILLRLISLRRVYFLTRAVFKLVKSPEFNKSISQYFLLFFFLSVCVV